MGDLQVVEEEQNTHDRKMPLGGTTEHRDQLANRNLPEAVLFSTFNYAVVLPKLSFLK